MATSEKVTASGWSIADGNEEDAENENIQKLRYDLLHILQMKENLAMEERARQRQRQIEKEDMKQRFKEERDYIKKKREVIEHDLESAERSLIQLSESDKDLIKQEIAALEKDYSLLGQREKREYERWKNRVEEDEKYIKQELDRIERDERFTRRSLVKEQEYSEQQRRKKHVRFMLSEQEDKDSTQLRGRSSTARGKSLQTEREEVGREEQPLDLSVRSGITKQDAEKMSLSELQKQMELLQKEMLSRTEAECPHTKESPFERQFDQINVQMNEEDGVRSGQSYPPSEAGYFGRERQTPMNFSSWQAVNLADGNKEKQFLTENANEDSLNTNVDNKYRDMKPHSEMMTTIDREVHEMDEQLRWIRQESLQLKERMQRIYDTERNLEKLEATIKQHGSSAMHLKQERDRSLPAESRYSEIETDKQCTREQSHLTEENLRAKILKDRMIESSLRRGERDLENEIPGEGNVKETDTDKKKEEYIYIEKDPFPKITPFSGEEDRPRGEASYEEWRFEANCLIRDVKSKFVIGQAIRKSLRGPAKREIIQLGPTATVEEIMERLESTFANVATGISIMQEFFIASQQQEESVSEWALRLEEIIKHAIDKGQIKEDEKNELLKDKFWRSLRSERLKNATRLDFRTIENFKQLVHAVRTEELSMRTNANAQHQAVSTNVTTRQDKKDEMDSSKQEEMYHTLVDLRRELKQYNKQKAQEKQWYRKKGQQQMNQQQGFQQQGFQQQGNQQPRNQNQQQEIP